MQADNSQIRPGLMVHVQGESKMGESSGQHVGTVDHIDGEYIKLKRSDSPDGHHRWVPLEWVDSIDENAVYLSCSFIEFQNNVLTSYPEDNLEKKEGSPSRKKDKKKVA